MSKSKEQINYQKLSDERLVALACKNNQVALEVLFSRYLKVIYNFIYRAVSDSFEAEDLTQEVFIKVWKNLSKFDQSKTFKPWLYKIAKNTYLDYYKTKQPSVFTALAEGVLARLNPLNQVWTTANDSPESLVDKNLLQAKFASVVSSLETSSADIVTLHHQARWNFRTIAETKGESINTVKSRYRRALNKIRRSII